MTTMSELQRVTQWNETRLRERQAQTNLPVNLGVFSMKDFKKYVVIPNRKDIRLYLDHLLLGDKVDVIKKKIENGGAFSIGIMEDEIKISYYSVVSVRDLSSEEQELPLFLLRVKCRTLEEVGHICHLHRMRHYQAVVSS